MAVLLLLLALVLVPALIGFIFEGERAKWPFRIFRHIGVGDPIVYIKQEASTHPALRARDIHPAERGDLYYYVVHKYWMVEDVLPDGRIVARTRTNKFHCLPPADPNLRKAKLLERVKYRDRFPRLATH